MREIKEPAIRVRAQVIADARREQIEYIGEHSFSIHVREPAERNEANDRVRHLIAHHYTVPLKSVQLLTGHRGKKKSFSVVL